MFGAALSLWICLKDYSSKVLYEVCLFYRFIINQETQLATNYYQDLSDSIAVFLVSYVVLQLSKTAFTFSHGY